MDAGEGKIVSNRQGMRRAWRFAALLPCLTGLAACAVGPEYRAPSPTALGIPESLPSSFAGASAPLDKKWWEGFEDPVLDQLVDRALQSNLDIEVARARLTQARQSELSSTAALLPQLGASVSATRTEGSQAPLRDATAIVPAATLSWEADLLGASRRSAQAAHAQALSSAARLSAVRLSVAGSVVRSYISVRLAAERLRIAKDNLSAQRETLQIVEWRVQAGLGSALDAVQARQLVAQTETAVPSLEAGIRASMNRLSTLGARAPGSMDGLLGQHPAFPGLSAPAPSLLPIDIVRHRPDVRSAEQVLVAETARIGVQQAQLYPNLGLTGTFSGTGSNLGTAIDASVLRLTGLLSQSLFDGGRRRAAVRSQRAATAAALADYKATVLQSLEEADNAYAGLLAAHRRLDLSAVAEDSARSAVLYLRSKYQSGLLDLRNLLDAERTLLASEDAHASARADLATAEVTLRLALGGGWDDSELQLRPTLGDAR